MLDSGDSTLIITPMQKKILIDGGGSLNRENYDVGKSVLLPYLLDRNISCLDYVFISHFDTDHYGGLLYLMENVKIKTLIFLKQEKESQEYKEVMEIVNQKKIKIRTLKAGDKIELEKDIMIEVLYPINEKFEDQNNNSMVLRLKYGEFKMLFTGDIEQKAEKDILEKKIDVSATILKVAHHGSKGSTTEEFLKKVNPQIAVIGVGKNNFGHPSREVLKRLEKYEVTTYRTDQNGEICIMVNKQGKVKISSQISNISK